MNNFKVRAFFQEFPFLKGIQLRERYVSFSKWGFRNPRLEKGCEKCQAGAESHDHPVFLEPDEVEEVSVARISPELLNDGPCLQGATGASVDISDNARMFLLDAEGKVLLEVKQSLHLWHNSPSGHAEDKDGETIGEALLRLGDLDKVVYVVKVHTGYRVEEHYSVGGHSVVLYKSPKGFTLRGWVEEQERRAKAQVEAMVAEIDAEV